jgi:hypothetical protein
VIVDDATIGRHLVLNADMIRNRHVLGALPTALTFALLAASPASAAITELGALPDGTVGSCPDAGVTLVPVPPEQRCQAVSRTTGYQAKVGPDRTLYVAPADGRIVAWTIALGKPGPKQTAYFSERLGGASQATVVVLDPRKKLVRRAVAKAPMQKLNDYFGRVVQFPLKKSLPIKKGQYVGLTVPSWAPALKIGIGSDTSWRASREARLCSDRSITSIQTALLGRRTSSEFGCLYRGTRLTYSATFIPYPTT